MYTNAVLQAVYCGLLTFPFSAT